MFDFIGRLIAFIGVYFIVTSPVWALLMYYDAPSWAFFTFPILSYWSCGLGHKLNDTILKKM